MHLRMQKRVRSSRKGLTLIELLVVLVVLAATAAMVVPKLGFVADQAGHAQSAGAGADLTSALETYKASTGTYPNNFDSLLDGGTAVSAFVFYPAVPPATGSYYELVDVDSYLYPLQRAGITSVYDFNAPSASVTEPTTQTTARALATGGKLAGVVSGNSLAKKVYPPNGTIPTNCKLIGLGIGPNCSANGSIMGSAPVQTAVYGKDQMGDGNKDYSRFIALFEVKAGSGAPGSAGSVKLRAVVDANSYTIEQRVGEYKNIAP